MQHTLSKHWHTTRNCTLLNVRSSIVCLAILGHRLDECIQISLSTRHILRQNLMTQTGSTLLPK